MTKIMDINTIQAFFEQHLLLIYLLLFTVVLGFEIIAKVPTVLHTPLMSGANAISGVVIIGGILLVKQAGNADYWMLLGGSLAIVLGMINVVGGFAVTDRMLEMFKKKAK